jgi:hypothetical protein
MKAINFVGPVKHSTPFEFAKRAYGFEADMEGNRKVELQFIKALTVPAARRITVANTRTNIAGEYI